MRLTAKEMAAPALHIAEIKISVFIFNPQYHAKNPGRTKKK
jgi:hypothetical protein